MNRNTRKKWTLANSKPSAIHLKAYNLAVTRAEAALEDAKRGYTITETALHEMEQKAQKLRADYDIAMAEYEANPTDAKKEALEDMRDTAMTYGHELQLVEVTLDTKYAARKNAQNARNLAIRKRELFVAACPVSATKLLKVAAKTRV